MAKLLITYGFPVYYILNPKKAIFLKILNHFLANVTKHIVVFYVGHGTYTKDKDGDEDDGNDEAFYFVDGTLIDDVLFQNLYDNKCPSSIATLVSDCCHSGSIWDLQSPKAQKPTKTISISAATDVQTAKQTIVDKLEQGMFTYNTKKLLTKSPKLSPPDLSSQLTPLLQKYSQNVVVCSTDKTLLTSPIFGNP
jgi:hypothetical protein